VATGAREAAAQLLAGPVGQAGGATVVDGIPDPVTAARLVAEAMEVYPSADRQHVAVDDGAAGRGGMPVRRLWSAGGGPAQDTFYAAPWLTDYLSAVCGTPVAPAGSRGSYSYYVGDGDFLGLHLDIETCDVTLISVLRDDGGPGDPAGGLLVHAAHLGQDLHAVRRAPHEGVVLKAAPGQSIVLLGGLLPHETVPVVADRPRVISALCFRAGC
jgi:hypothetical protein